MKTKSLSLIAAEFNPDVVDSNEVLVTVVENDDGHPTLSNTLLELMGEDRDTDKIWEIIETSGKYKTFKGESSIDKMVNSKTKANVYTDADTFLKNYYNDYKAEFIHLYFLRSNGELNMYAPKGSFSSMKICDDLTYELFSDDDYDELGIE